jgi:toxin ParE1/3/4
MSFRLRISKRAVRDIEQAIAYTLQHFGERKHEVYKSLIREALADVAAHPLAPPAKPRPELHRNARTFHIARKGKPARHFFLYRVVGKEFLDIGRLLHDSMDLQRHLPEGFEADES